MVENGKMLEINDERSKMVKILMKIEIDDERSTVFNLGKGTKPRPLVGKRKCQNNGLRW